MSVLSMWMLLLSNSGGASADPTTPAGIHMSTDGLMCCGVTRHEHVSVKILLHPGHLKLQRRNPVARN